MTAACPRCGAGVAVSQEYCLGCGLRLPLRGRVGPPPARSIRLPLLGTALLAVAGAAAAIALTWERVEPVQVTTALGGSVTVPQPAAIGLASWPQGKRGWTIVLASLPKTDGRPAAVTQAERARARGLEQVGVIDSARVTSLRPGYWVVFTGIYQTEAEATSALQAARTASREAQTRRIVPAAS